MGAQDGPGRERPVADQVPRVVGLLTDVDRDWLAASPFCVLATADADGRCDASPKGDPAGTLVHVIDDATIADAWVTAVAGKQPGHGIDDPSFLQPDRPMSAIGG